MEYAIKLLNKLELRCLVGNCQDYDFNILDVIHKFPENCKLKDAFKCVIQSVIRLDYENVLQLNLSDFGLVVTPFNVKNPVSNIEFFKSEFSDDPYLAYINHLITLFVGVSALQEFVKRNISGPIAKASETFQVVKDLFPDFTNLRFEIDKLLSCDGEFIYSNVNNPELLYVSKILLASIGSELCLSSKWWLLRCLFIHQWILPERNITLHDKLKILLKEISVMSWFERGENMTAKLIFFIESAQINLYYHEIVPAKKCVQEAQSITGLEITLSGAVGKRTQYQQKPVAQLFVKLKRGESKLNEFIALNDSYDFPCDLLLQDDTLLNNVMFIDNEEKVVNDLTTEEQIVLLASCCLVKRSGMFDELLREEILSYVSCLLSQPKVWSLYLKALIIRCKEEKTSSRKVERAIMQLEAIVNSLKSDKPSFLVRQCLLFCTAFPTYWMLEKELASLLLSIGATKSALEIYERLELWENVIECYQRLGRTHSAEKLILEQLEIKETPMLWCLLGDVTDKPDHYHKAFELSEQKSARALRSLGYFYFKRKDYENSVLYFQQTLELNHLQPTVWFSLGFAATQIEKFEISAKAYRQVVLLDQDNFEAWNNLSNAYIKTGQKSRAWRSLQEALKCNYEEWRVWENFLIVSIDVGAFEDVIRAWHRLLDIKGKHRDSEVLEILVNAISKDIPDINGLPASRLRKKTLEFFGRLTSIVTNDSKIWELYSLLCCSDNDYINNKDVLEKAVMYQQKSLRYCSMQDQWEKDFKLCTEVLKCALKLAELSLYYVKLLENNFKIQQKSSAKLALQSVLSRCKKYIHYFSESENGELQTISLQLNSILDEILAD